MSADPKQIAAGMREEERRALLVKGAPIPDSIWHGRLSGLRRMTGAAEWTWSPLGLEVRRILQGESE